MYVNRTRARLLAEILLKGSIGGTAAGAGLNVTPSGMTPAAEQAAKTAADVGGQIVEKVNTLLSGPQPSPR